jgi:hypothetical protein
MEPDLRDLLSAWLGGEFDAARGDELLARVRQDEAFRRAFVAEIRVLGMLRAVQSTEPRWLRLEDELGWSAADPAGEEALEDRVVRQIADLPRQRWSRAWVAGVAVAASALLMAGVWALRSGRSVHREPPLATRPAANTSAAKALAMVLKLDAVQWEPGAGPHPSEGDLLAGRIRFRSGRATLSMLSGVVLVVEGPADLELVAIDRVFCRLGRLRTRVPEGAEGFVVSAPGSAVVDLGTEFALSVDANGKARVTVIAGEVEGAVLSAAGIPQRSQRMGQNKAFEINPRSGQIVTVPVSSQIIAPADLAASPLILDPAYPDAVLANQPSSYWRFEELSDGAIPNAVPAGPPLRARGPIRLTHTLGRNQSIVFPAGDSQQYLEMDGLFAPAESSGYAVELWFLPETISHAALASLSEPTDTTHIKHQFITELTAWTRQTLHPPAAVRFLHRWPPDSAGGVNVYSQARYVPYRWHHLVAQVRVERMELYLDGALTVSMPVNPERASLPGLLLLGRLSKVPIDHWWWGRPFVGLMDEVALYDHPLSAEEIRSHYCLAHPRIRPEP